MSVIIPAFNVADFIAETLQSAFAQTLKDFEVLVIDDDSPDKLALETALLPFDGRIKFIRQAPNRGVSATRNRGLVEARGELAAFLDGDDQWSPEFLKEQVEFLKRGHFDLVYSDGLLFGDSKCAGRRFTEGAPSLGPVTFPSLIRGDCNILTSGVVARREKLFEAGLFDERLRTSEDYELWVRLAHKGARIGHHPKILVRHRCRESSLFSDPGTRVGSILAVYEHIARSLDLAPNERSEVETAMKQQRAIIYAEEGKKQLLSGHFEKACISLGRAQALYPDRKGALVLWALGVAPKWILQLAHFLLLRSRLMTNR